MDIIILLGGFGTRLSSLTKGVPKSLMPVGDQLFLDILMKKIFDSGVIKKVFLSLHYKPMLFTDFLKDKSYKNIVSTIIEPKPLGTGGAIRYIIENTKISDNFFVINGDSVSDISLSKMKDCFCSSNYRAMIGLSKLNNITRYGTVNFKNDEIISFNEKTEKEDVPGWINNGYYLFNNTIFKSYSGNFSLEYNVFPLLVKKKALGCFKVHNDNFIDMGVPIDYKKLLERYVEK